MREHMACQGVVIPLFLWRRSRSSRPGSYCDGEFQQRALGVKLPCIDFGPAFSCEVKLHFHLGCRFVSRCSLLVTALANRGLFCLSTFRSSSYIDGLVGGQFWSVRRPGIHWPWRRQRLFTKTSRRSCVLEAGSEPFTVLDGMIFPLRYACVV